MNGYLPLNLDWNGERFPLLVQLETDLVQSIFEVADENPSFLPGLSAAEVPLLPGRILIAWRVSSLTQLLELQPGDRFSLDEAEFLEFQQGDKRGGEPIALPVCVSLSTRNDGMNLRCSFLRSVVDESQ